MELWAAISKIPLLAAFGENDAALLREHCKLKTVRRGVTIWSDGDASDEFFFIVRGRAKLVKATNHGRETIVQLGLAGQLLCANAPCANVAYCCKALSLEDDTEVLSVAKWVVFDAVDRQPTLARMLMQEMTCRSMALCRRIDELTAGQIEQRICTLLLRLAQEVGVQRGPVSVWIPIALSRQDLADMCGTTLETAIRVMSRLKRQDAVTTLTRGFLVHDCESLKRLAAGTGTSGRCVTDLGDAQAPMANLRVH